LIAKDKETAALKALQAVLVRGRAMAFHKEDHSKLENLLDRAEYLVALIYRSEDMTATFRANLVELAELHQCGIALTTFDTNC
jgi:hypothetical protein